MVHLPGRFLPRFLTSARRRRLLSSPTDAPSWCISLEALLQRHPTSTMPMLHTAVVTAHLVGASSGRGPCHATLHRHDYDASNHLLPAHLVGPFPGGILPLVRHRHDYATSGHPLRAHTMRTFPRRGPFQVSLRRQHLRRLRPSPTGLLSWCIVWEGPLLLPPSPTSA